MGQKSRGKKHPSEAKRRLERQKRYDRAPQIRFEPSPGLMSSRAFVNEVGLEAILRAFISLKHLHSADVIEEQTQKVCGHPFRLQVWQNLMVAGAGRKAWYHPLNLFQNLGQACKVNAFGVDYWMVTPRPHRVVSMLEKLRLDTFEFMRERLGGPDTFEDVFRNPTVSARVERLKPQDAALWQYECALDGTAGKMGLESSLCSMSESIVLANLLITWCRKRYGLELPDHDSWVRGRAAESKILSTRLHPRESWHPSVQQAVAELEVDIPKLGRLVPPEPRDGDGHDGNREEPKRAGRRRIWDPERLLFYMGLDEYIEPRALEAGDRFGYIAVQFRGNKVGLDTAQTDNRFFGLQGPMEECLQLANLTRTEIRASPMCTLPLVHDSHGTWRTTIKRWLRGELDQS